ncbi:MAG: sensor histidine kinase [Candidatus Kapaibacterium sp.]|nr:MAG: sensor histidine kinase [Candidatus Kapabacteria bacterium]
MKKRRIGIQQKFVSIVLVLLVIIAVFIAVFFPQRQTAQMNKYMNEKILVTTQMIAFNASTGMAFDDAEAVQQTLAILPSLSGVKFVSVVKLTGEEVAFYRLDSAAYNSLLPNTKAVLAAAKHPANLNITSVGDIALYAEPVIFKGTTYGKVVAGISRTELENDAKESIIIALVVGAGIIVLGGVIMMFLSSRLVNPIRFLARAAGQVSAGNLEASVKVTTNDEIEVLGNAFNHMVTNIRKALEEVQSSLKKAEDANSRKTELLSIVSHDLKSPLASVLAAIKLVELGDITAEEFPEMGAMIRQSCERMIDLIESLLASSALEMGRIQVNKADGNAKELMQRVVESNYLKAEAKAQKLVVQHKGDQFILYADNGLMHQVLENFVSNALKYSPPETTITARVLASPETIRFEVQDEGPGLTEEDKQKLFGFFQRLSAKPTGGESSHGVGLAITKRVVDLHNGKIWAESELGKGTTFVVVLPRNTDKALAA